MKVSNKRMVKLFCGLDEVDDCVRFECTERAQSATGRFKRAVNTFCTCLVPSKCKVLSQDRTSVVLDVEQLTIVKRLTVSSLTKNGTTVVGRSTLTSKA